MARIPIIVLFAACMLPMASLSITVDCPFLPSSPYSNDCYNKLPFCRRFTRVDDPEHPGKFIFTCEVCDQGFKSRGPVNRVSSSWGILPSDDTTLLCDLDESYTGEVGVKPLFLAKMFPNCHSIKWSGVVRSGSDTAALFECAQCKQYFSKNLELRERTGVFNNIGNQFRVCKRTEGTFECGPLCRRKEIPDCEQFTISKVDVVKQTSTSVTAYYDAGYFYCNSPIHGMVSMQVPTYASTDMDRKKLITELSDNGAEVQCIPQINFVDFPHCLRYTAVETSFGLKYKCLQCRSGFIAEENPASYRNLCKPVDIYNAVPDAYWQFEVPNCLQISRTNTKKGSDGYWNARY